MSRRVLITPAAWEPLEVEEMKTRPELRITGTTDDIFLAGALRSAIQAYEDYTDRILCLSTWDLYLDAWPDPFELPAPLSSVTSIKYYDTLGVLQTLATTYYKVDTSNPTVARVTLKYGQSWPSLYDEANNIIVRFVAGYADPSEIPPMIRDGLMLKVQEIYDGINRSGVYYPCWSGDRRWPV